MEAVGKNYGQVEALQDISLDIRPGELFGLIGPDGAGKTTLFRILTTLLLADKGTATVCGLDVVRDYKKIRTMVGYMPGRFSLYQDLTVEENLRIGAYLRKDSIKEDMEEVYKLFPRLKEREWQLAGTLSGGEQQMLAVGRALMAKPKLVMMDEPSLGLAPLVVKGIFEIIKEINRQGITVLLIEQNANMALKTADWAYVMQTGTILMQGEGKELLENEEVKAAYLGKAK